MRVDAVAGFTRQGSRLTRERLNLLRSRRLPQSRSYRGSDRRCQDRDEIRATSSAPNRISHVAQPPTSPRNSLNPRILRKSPEPRWARGWQAERAGFEPAVRVNYPYDGLANRCLQPLGHLSGCCETSEMSPTGLSSPRRRASTNAGRVLRKRSGSVRTRAPCSPTSQAGKPMPPQNRPTTGNTRSGGVGSGGAWISPHPSGAIASSTPGENRAECGRCVSRLVPVFRSPDTHGLADRS